MAGWRTTWMTRRQDGMWWFIDFYTILIDKVCTTDWHVWMKHKQIQLRFSFIISFMNYRKVCICNPWKSTKTWITSLVLQTHKTIPQLIRLCRLWPRNGRAMQQRWRQGGAASTFVKVNILYILSIYFLETSFHIFLWHLDMFVNLEKMIVQDRNDALVRHFDFF